MPRRGNRERGESRRGRGGDLDGRGEHWQRSDSGDAFIADPGDGPLRISDDLAATLAEDFVRSVTSGDDADEETREEVLPEEIGGPFLETSARTEFARGIDESNPADAEAEPLPQAVGGLAQPAWETAPDEDLDEEPL
jgi:hypothetical protein